MVEIESNFSFQDGFILGPVYNVGKNSKDRKVFDWDKFTTFLLNSPKINNLYVGLNGDFKYTYTQVIANGEIVLTPSDQARMASSHCIPVYTENMEEGEECWLFAGKTNYDAYTFWPEHCVKKLKGTYYVD